MGAEPTHDWRTAAASALEWWRDAGVDTLVADLPRDWLAAPAATERPGGTGAGAPAVVREAPAPEVLPDTLEAFIGWRLSDAAPDAGWSTTRLAPQGPASSDLMILTDMPEDGDAESGVLVGGAAGRLLDRMLVAIGRDRQSVYLASLLVARPLGGRIPPELEERFAELARHHVALAAPTRLLLLGQAAGRAVLGADAAQSRGRLHGVNHKSGQSQAVASLHPRFLLDRPAKKAEAWRDLQLLIGGSL